MKKVGCVIAYKKNHNNYGTSLQAYAMLKKIEQLGYEVEVINYIKRLTVLQKVRYVFNAFRCGEIRYILRSSSIAKNQKLHSDYAEGLQLRTSAVNNYKKRKIEPLFHDFHGYESLHKGSKQYAVVVVGSDQVWTPLSLPNKFFNLLFVDDSVKKVAYASSFGVTEIPKFQHKATSAYLNRFSDIGVREQRGKEIVETLSKKDAVVVADPTLLMSREEWSLEISESKVSITEPYIFCYIISESEEARQGAIELGRNTGLKVYCIRHMEQYRPQDESFGDTALYNVGPNDFVKLISGAEYVCTDSFHCTVFSIIFHRKFMTFYRSLNSSKNSKNSRIDSLFSVLGVPREHIFDGNVNKIESLIEWDEVDSNLSKLRTQSLSFLKKALG